MTCVKQGLLVLLVFAGLSVAAEATTYIWQKTDGGDMAVEGNWSPNTGLIGGQNLYALHAPAARRTSLTLPQSGKALTIVSHLPLDGSRFGEVYLNGVRLEKPLVRHAQILAGGTLEFR